MESTENTNNRETPASVPYVVYRDAIDDNRWVVKKLVVALIVAIALLFVSNMAWLIAWNLYDYSSETITTTVDSDGEGIANYTGGDGGVNTYGESFSNQTDSDQDETVRLDGDETPSQDTEEVTGEPGN